MSPEEQAHEFTIKRLRQVEAERDHARSYLEPFLLAIGHYAEFGDDRALLGLYRAYQQEQR